MFICGVCLKSLGSSYDEAVDHLIACEAATDASPPEAPIPVSYKVAMLEEVKEIVGARGLNYGTPEDNFQRIARRWHAHLTNRYGEVPFTIDDIDVAAMCTDLKLARLENEPLHEDSWKDIAGYAACGYDIAMTRKARSDHNGVNGGDCNLSQPISCGEKVDWGLSTNSNTKQCSETFRNKEQERVTQSWVDAAVEARQQYGRG
jgi:hypothetical protein